jgi:quinohemoprotein ethanol dehydrogenase
MNGTTQNILWSLGSVLLTCLAGASSASRAASNDTHDQTAAVTEKRILTEAAAGRDWLVTGGNFGQTHFSPLRAITRENVQQLGLAWWMDVDSPMGLAVEPLEVDGIIYVSASRDQVLAIDAASGHLLWHFDPHLSLSEHSYYTLTNKGVAVWDGKVFVGTGDCRVIALDAANGKPIWDSRVCADNDQPLTGIGAAPRVGGGRIYVGYGSADHHASGEPEPGARGALVALDAQTGKVLWRAWNIPGNPANGFENPAMKMAAATWPGKDAWKEGGGGVWEPITYDPETNLVIYGTQGEDLFPGSGDRLFTNCVVAVHADTGEFAWYVPTFKYVPPRFEGSPENFHVLVTDLTIAGRRRHVAITVPRFGGFFILDAKNGEIISEKSLADRPAAQQSPPASTGEPRNRTNRNWWPMSYSPVTGLVYIPAYDSPERRHPGDELTSVGRLLAWDPITQSARWSIAEPLAVNGGVLSTAGGLVFQGQGSGEFAAYAADSGRKLWSVKTGSAIQSVPVTYTIKGEQYVLLPVGLGSASRLFNANSVMGTPESKRGPARIYAFKPGAHEPFPYPHVTVPNVPKPPLQTASAEVISRGAHVIEKYGCWGCHGGRHLDGSGAWILNGAVPDLRYMPIDVHEQFAAIVLGGTRRQNGMPGFADGQSKEQMTADELNALHAYIVDLQWKAYEADQLNPGQSGAGPKN